MSAQTPSLCQDDETSMMPLLQWVDLMVDNVDIGNVFFALAAADVKANVT